MNEGIEDKKLLVAYEALQAENLALKGEVEALRRQLGLISEKKPSEAQISAPEEINREANVSEELPLVHRHSSSDKKIALFMALFRGREDVYAKRWESQKSGKSGYQPVCTNEWQTPLCDKRKQALTRPPDDFKEADRQGVGENISLLVGAGIHVVRKSAIHQKFTIIDQHIVWYGSINFLSFGSSEETIMRLESHAIANELLGILQ